MEKKKNGAAGVVSMCVLFTLALFITGLSGLFICVHFDDYRRWGLDCNKFVSSYEQDRIARLADEAAMDALGQYSSRVFGEGIRLTMPEYDEQRSNFSFTITPVDENDDLPTFTNYRGDAFSYCMETTYSGTTPDYNYSFSFEITDEIKNSLTRNDSEFSDMFANGDYIAQPEDVWRAYNLKYYGSENNTCNMIEAEKNYLSGMNDTQDKIDDYISANGLHMAYDTGLGNVLFLDKSEEFRRKYNAFFADIDEKYEFWTYYESYDDANNIYSVDVAAYNTYELVLIGGVKSELTAYDEFYYSRVSEMTKFMYKYAVVIVLAGFLLLVISVVFLGRSMVRYSNENGNGEPGVLELFPMDIAAAAFGVLLLGACGGFYRSFGEQLMCMVFAFIGFPFVMAMFLIKVKKRAVFEKLFVVELAKRILKIFKFFLRKLGKVIKTDFLDNISIFGKYLGVYAVLSLVEILCLAEINNWYYLYELMLMIFFVVVEKLAVGIIIGKACVNMDRLKKAGNELAAGNLDYEVETERLMGDFRQHGENLNSIRTTINSAVEESLKSERMKAELITNVSHDIKTPLTSIINYVDLLGKEELNNRKADEYLEVLERQSAKLKKLIQDLIDASKASTGNVEVVLEKTDINMIIAQTLGEFEERLSKRNIVPVVSCCENVYAMADGRHLWRVIENLFVNIEKYASENSRAYIDIADYDDEIRMVFKNVSDAPLNISGDELMERFVRGDSSRNTEGSGLGLSISKSLIELQGGSMKIVIDGDLFKVIIAVRKFR